MEIIFIHGRNYFAPENTLQLLRKPLKERKCTFKSPRIPQLKIIQSRLKSSYPKQNIKRRKILQFLCGKLWKCRCFCMNMFNIFGQLVFVWRKHTNSTRYIFYMISRKQLFNWLKVLMLIPFYIYEYADFAGRPSSLGRDFLGSLVGYKLKSM